MYEVSWFQATDVSHHTCEKRIGGNVEGHTKAHIARPLVHETRKLAVRNVKLTKHVARWQSHQAQISRIPSRHDDPAIRWILLDFPDALCKLINALAGVVCMHVFVFGSEVAP